jgi:hypothetical protein
MRKHFFILHALALIAHPSHSKILVIDDEKDEEFKKMMEDIDKIMTAPKARGAIIDDIPLKMEMPTMSGWKCSKCLRFHEWNRPDKCRCGNRNFFKSVG